MSQLRDQLHLILANLHGCTDVPATALRHALKESADEEREIERLLLSPLRDEVTRSVPEFHVSTYEELTALAQSIVDRIIKNGWVTR